VKDDDFQWVVESREKRVVPEFVWGIANAERICRKTGG